MHITLQEKIFRKISINPIEFTIHHVYSNELIENCFSGRRAFCQSNLINLLDNKDHSFTVFLHVAKLIKISCLLKCVLFSFVTGFSFRLNS